MKAEIKVPAAGESVTEATIAEWNKQDGDIVNRDEVLLVLETDKASMEIVAEHAGKLSIKVEEGETVAVGDTIGEIDTDAAGVAKKPAAKEEPKSESQPASPPAKAQEKSDELSPAVRKIVDENNLDIEQVPRSGKGGRITKDDALTAAQNQSAAKSPTAAQAQASGNVPAPAKRSEAPPLPTLRQPGNNEEWREPMSRLRKTIATRLVESQQTAAILTTFNEIDMTEVMNLRKKYKDSFKDKYGVNLGFMGFFVKATIEALKEFPKVNASIDGDEIVFRNFYNVGIAVGTEKGLLVPVIRNTEMMQISDIELAIKHYAVKAREGKISIDDLSGGTFTISNGGVYGSLMSTPIINPPQTGILGLHKIEERPVAIDGEVVVRPMMYVALSYDHRLIDGSESVRFLVKIKECMEDPNRMLLEI